MRGCFIIAFTCVCYTCWGQDTIACSVPFNNRLHLLTDSIGGSYLNEWEAIDSLISLTLRNNVHTFNEELLMKPKGKIRFSPGSIYLAAGYSSNSSASYNYTRPGWKFHCSRLYHCRIRFGQSRWIVDEGGS